MPSSLSPSVSRTSSPLQCDEDDGLRPRFRGRATGSPLQAFRGRSWLKTLPVAGNAKLFWSVDVG